jgi:hypothetical protein
MKLVFCFRYVWLSLIIVGLGLITPSLWGQTDYLHAQVSKRKLKVKIQPLPSLSRGYPGNRKAAISRDNCSTTGTDMVALAPEFVKKAVNSSQLDETSVWGQTVMERPTLWFFVPATGRTGLEFVLQNKKDQVIYRSTIATPLRDGVISVSIPSSVQPLELNQDYRWTLKAKVSCGGNALESKFVEGWVQRVSLPAGVVVQQGRIYAEQGIWYDAVTILASQRQRSPNDLQLKQDWEDLLGAAQLEAMAQYPILK